MKKQKKAATASRKTKGVGIGRRHRREPGATKPGAKRAAHHARGVSHPADVVAGGNEATRCVQQQLDATGRTGVSVREARRELAVQIAVIAGTLRQRAVDSMAVQSHRMAFNDVIDLTIDQRIEAGDAEAVFDSVAEAMERLDNLQNEFALTLHVDVATLTRISEVRRRQNATGRQWRGSSWTNQEPATTDRCGKEPGGAGR